MTKMSEYESPNVRVHFGRMKQNLNKRLSALKLHKLKDLDGIDDFEKRSLIGHAKEIIEQEWNGFFKKIGLHNAKLERGWDNKLQFHNYSQYSDYNIQIERVVDGKRVQINFMDDFKEIVESLVNIDVDGYVLEHQNKEKLMGQIFVAVSLTLMFSAAALLIMHAFAPGMIIAGLGIGASLTAEGLATGLAFAAGATLSTNAANNLSKINQEQLRELSAEVGDNAKRINKKAEELIDLAEKINKETERKVSEMSRR